MRRWTSNRRQGNPHHGPSTQLSSSSSSSSNRLKISLLVLLSLAYGLPFVFLWRRQGWDESMTNLYQEAIIPNHNHRHNNDNNDDHPFLLDVPFYIYDQFLMLAANGTMVGNRSIDDWQRHRVLSQGRQLTEFDQRLLPKHSDDYLLVHALLRHPMRTHAPDQAKLFFVPTLINEITDQFIYQEKAHGTHVRWRVPVDNVGNDDSNTTQYLYDTDILQWANDQLGKSPWFQKLQGANHILVASHWRTHKIFHRYPNLYNCHAVNFEKRPVNSPNRITLSSTYVGHACRNSNHDQSTEQSTAARARAILKQKTHDFSVVATMKPIYKVRNNVCAWLKQENSSTFRTGKCGVGTMCPLVAQAKYAPHVPGDTPGSNRLIDSLLSGTIPIFVTEKQYEVLPPFVDWKAFSYFANATAQLQFTQDMHRIAQLPDETYLHKLRTILEHQALLDWSANHTTNHDLVDTYMYAFARILVPQFQPRRHVHPRHKAIRLDPIESLRRDYALKQQAKGKS